MANTLVAVVDFHSSVFGWDKTMKNLSYAFGLASCGVARIYGPENRLAEGLKQLGSNLSMYRMCTRLGGGSFGVPPELENMINHSWYGGWEDKRIKWCVWLQSVTMLGYYPLENLAWAGYVAPKLFPVDADKLCQISCIFWVLWILIDFYATYLRFRELQKMERELSAKASSLGEGAEWAEAARKMLAAKRLGLWLYTLRLVLWLPNAVHWSLPPGHKACLPNWMVQVPLTPFAPRGHTELFRAFGLGEGLVGTYTLATGRGISRPALPPPPTR